MGFFKFLNPFASDDKKGDDEAKKAVKTAVEEIVEKSDETIVEKPADKPEAKPVYKVVEKPKVAEDNGKKDDIELEFDITDPNLAVLNHEIVNEPAPTPKPEPKPEQKPEAKPEPAPEKPVEKLVEKPVVNPAVKPQKAQNTTDNIISTQEEIARVILSYLRQLTLRDNFVGCRIWVYDATLAMAVNTRDFEKYMRRTFDDALFKSLGGGKFEVFEQRPPKDILVHEVYAGKLWFRIDDREAPPTKPRVIDKALVAQVDDFGTLEVASYALDATKKNRYHIGRGKVKRTATGSIRKNDIVIRDDEPDEAQLDLNGYVSGSQADIVFETDTFYLQAMPSGCRTTSSNSTKILRGEEVIRLIDPKVLYPLRDGDTIELGRKVLLSFNLVED